MGYHDPIVLALRGGRRAPRCSDRATNAICLSHVPTDNILRYTQLVRFAIVAVAAVLLGCPQDLVVLQRDGHTSSPRDATTDPSDSAAPDAVSALDDATTRDDSGVGPDAGVGTDSGFRDADSVDVGALDAGPDDAGACFDDPFTPCVDPAENPNRNDRVTDPDYFTGGGCLHHDGDVVMRDWTMDAVLCSAEPADFYAANFVGCTNLDVRVIATVEPLAPCDHDDWELHAYRQRTPLVCGTDVECMLDGNKKVVRFLLDRDFSTLQDRRFEVRRTANGVEVPYRIRIQAF